MVSRSAVVAAAAVLLASGMGGVLAQSSGSQETPGSEGATGEAAPASGQLPTPVAERVATLVVLDKFTSTSHTFEVKPGSVIEHGRLRIHVRSCEASPPWERPEAAAFLQVDERTLQGRMKRVYSGWMFARAPGLHPFDHPAYAVLFRSCRMNFPERGDDTVVAAPPAPAPAPEASPAPAPEGE